MQGSFAPFHQLNVFFFLVLTEHLCVLVLAAAQEKVTNIQMGMPFFAAAAAASPQAPAKWSGHTQDGSVFACLWHRTQNTSSRGMMNY